VLQVLRRAQARGFLGPEPVAAHVEHGRHLAEVLGAELSAGRLATGVHDGGVEPIVYLDLGSGAGVPGLILATCWPGARGTLLDSSRRRCALLTEAVVVLGLEGRVRVRCGRAETLARAEDLRAGFNLVVARGFGGPAVTAECAVGFLDAGGLLAVTEPPPGGGDPSGPTRWPVDPLATLGLSAAQILRSDAVGVAVMKAMAKPADRWPRADGRPAKSPLW
jgi:16S rRNA (guanine527-N7)-methyltransferase